MFGGKRGLHPQIAFFLLPEHQRPRCGPRGTQEADALVSGEGFASSSDLSGLALPVHLPLVLGARPWSSKVGLPPPQPTFLVKTWGAHLLPLYLLILLNNIFCKETRRKQEPD